MASYKDAFPSKYLKAENLGTTRPVVTIDKIGFEEVGTGTNKERKLVAHFEQDAKPLVLNRINADTIAEIVGTDDYEEWVGRAIELFATRTEFQGKRVPCIRICAPQTKPANARSKAGAATRAEDDDAVGF